MNSRALIWELVIHLVYSSKEVRFIEVICESALGVLSTRKWVMGEGIRGALQQSQEWGRRAAGSVDTKHAGKLARACRGLLRLGEVSCDSNA